MSDCIYITVDGTGLSEAVDRLLHDDRVKDLNVFRTEKGWVVTWVLW